MIERHFSHSKVLIRLRSGSVGPYLPALRERCGAEPVPTGYQRLFASLGSAVTQSLILHASNGIYDMLGGATKQIPRQVIKRKSP
jgi:hypothetical protein